MFSLISVSGRVRVAVRLRPRNAEELKTDLDFADCVELEPEVISNFHFDCFVRSSLLISVPASKIMEISSFVCVLDVSKVKIIFNCVFFRQSLLLSLLIS